jgi:hypothetical protein
MYVQTLTNYSFQMHLIKNMIIINNSNLKFFAIYMYIYSPYFMKQKFFENDIELLVSKGIGNLK